MIQQVITYIIIAGAFASTLRYIYRIFKPIRENTGCSACSGSCGLKSEIKNKLVL